MNYTEKLLAFEQELHSGFRDPKNPDLVRWTPSFISPVSFVKVFEYVKGARIEGSAPNGSIVAIVTNITTNQGRKFVYSQITISNGSYEFVVPYSTEGPIEGGTNFDVFAAPYKIMAGHIENETIVWDREKEVEVDEKEVIEGKTVRVDLLLLPS
jgi:dolichyl-diphosphooligosaccharide--protein glycosyltransferase